MVPKREVYLDNSASTPVDPRVIEAMLPYFGEVFGNSTASHRQGHRGESAIEDARETIAGILNCAAREIVFTSCGTESDNLAIRGAAWNARRRGNPTRLITTPVEHSAVINTMRQMRNLMDFEMEIVPVDKSGRVMTEAFLAACQRGGSIASVIYASNEVGVIQDLPLLAEIAHEFNIIFHTDAVQAGGQLSLDVNALGVDMLSLSAHKFYGPKGVGILYVKNGIQLEPSQSGGSHEDGRRAGTHNTAFIVGMAKALELAYQENEARLSHFAAMRDRLIQGILESVPGAEISGHPIQRLPSHASFVIPDVDANALLMHLDMGGVCASSGSSCKTGDPEPSEILLGLGFTPSEAKCGLRLSVGLHTTADDIDYALDVLAASVAKLRRLQGAPVS